MNTGKSSRRTLKARTRPVLTRDRSCPSAYGGAPAGRKSFKRTSQPSVARSPVTSFARQQNFFCLVDAGGEIGRSALIGVELHHQPPMRGTNRLSFRARLE